MYVSYIYTYVYKHIYIYISTSSSSTSTACITDRDVTYRSTSDMKCCIAVCCSVLQRVAVCLYHVISYIDVSDVYICIYIYM